MFILLASARQSSKRPSISLGKTTRFTLRVPLRSVLPWKLMVPSSFIVSHRTLRIRRDRPLAIRLNWLILLVKLRSLTFTATLSPMTLRHARFPVMRCRRISTRSLRAILARFTFWTRNAWFFAISRSSRYLPSWSRLGTPIRIWRTPLITTMLYRKSCSRRWRFLCLPRRITTRVLSRARLVTPVFLIHRRPVILLPFQRRTLIMTHRLYRRSWTPLVADSRPTVEKSHKKLMTLGVEVLERGSRITPTSLTTVLKRCKPFTSS